MKTAFVALAPLLLLFAAIVGWNSFYVLPMTEQAIITQFGKVRGEPVTEPGLHFKMPMLDTVNRFEKRVLEWDGPPLAMTTRDKVYVTVYTFARWRITDPLQFLKRLRDERSAQSRLTTALSSNTMSTIAKHDLIEIIRTTKDRVVNPEALPAGVETTALLPIREGRVAIEEIILKQAAPMVKEYGIELLDVRFKRVNYNPDVLSKIHERMISEREQIAERFRSEGAGEAARINGQRELELKKVQSEAYRKVQEIRGKAEAEAARIYSTAFNASPQAAEFYGFQKTLETYEKTLAKDSTVVFSTDSDLFRLMKTLSPAMAADASPAEKAAPVPPAAAATAPAPAPAAPAQPEPPVERVP